MEFAPGDRWTALGDSLTHSGSYHTWLQLFQLTRYPARDLSFTNCGIAGDTATGAWRRLKWDVGPTRPTLCTVMLGMNDVGLALYLPEATGTDLAERRRVALVTYERSLRAVVGELSAAGVRVGLVTPTIFDQWATLPAPRRPGVEVALATCADFVRRLASELAIPLVELHEPLLRLTRQAQAEEPRATLIGPDRIHPGAVGHFVIAYHFLRTMRARGEVSAIAIDAPTREVSTRHGRLSELDMRANGEVAMAFTWTAESLPFPIEADLAPALRRVPFAEEFNRETLRIAGLPRGRCVLRIDAMDVGQFSEAELAGGIDLATLALTPQLKQARAVARVLGESRQHTAETARNIALVEHQSAPAEAQPLTWESARPHYERRLAQISPVAPANANLLRIYRLYPELKANEAEHRRTAERMTAEARRLAQLVARRYAVIRLP